MSKFLSISTLVVFTALSVAPAAAGRYTPKPKGVPFPMAAFGLPALIGLGAFGVRRYRKGTRPS